MLTERLKEQTKTNHQLLEKKLVGKMRTMRSTNDYADLLSLFYKYFGGLEKAIVKHLDQSLIPDYPARRKASALAADLTEMGAMVPPLARISELPAIHNHQQALGALYVIEGSTLGGKIISKMISHQIPSTDGHGLTFFNSYGDDTLAMWERFKVILDDPKNLPGDDIIEAANETFLKFSHYFD
jgi:heme oxygenase